MQLIAAFGNTMNILKTYLCWFFLASLLLSHDVAQATTKEKPRILMVLTSHGQLGDTGKSTGFYLSEVSHPYEVFSKAGFAVDFVSPKGGKPPVDGLNVKDQVNEAFLKDVVVQKRIAATLRPDQVKEENYDAIYFAGGHGVMWDFPDNEALQTLTRKIYERGGVVAAVCHGPAALVNVRLSNGKYLVDGKEIASFTNEEEEAVKLTKAMPFLLETRLRKRGAKFVKVKPFEPKFVESQRVVTGQNPASAYGVADVIVKLVKETKKRS